jgi:hypothetical protein
MFEMKYKREERERERERDGKKATENRKEQNLPHSSYT